MPSRLTVATQPRSSWRDSGDVATPEQVALFRRELQLCEVGRGQTVAVLWEGDQLCDYAEASLEAASQLGAAVKAVHLANAEAPDPNERLRRIGRNALSRDPVALAACCQADMVVDHMLLLFSPEQLAIQAAGARILLVVEPMEVLERLFPTAGLRRRVEAAERRLVAARALRFVNDAGTDVIYRIDGSRVLTEYGYSATPGRWDHWPGGFLATVALPNGVSGRVVMEVGDILYPLKELVSERIEFVIRDGQVQDIAGGAQAKMLRRLMDDYADPRAYAVSHIGWGLNQACRWDPALPGIGMDGRAHHGNVLFSLGPDTEFGGTNDTLCHLDMPMRDCTLWLDDELIVEAGDVVPSDMRAV